LSGYAPLHNITWVRKPNRGDDESGNPVKWDGEFTNPGTLHRRGWTKDMFKPGDQITMIGNRAKNGANVLRVLKLQMADGKEITALGGEDN
jgi:hypothetical protein